jgi:hypothetical protein
MGPFLIILGIYLLYNFIVYFVIPVYKTSRKVQQQFRNMQHQGENANPNNSPFQNNQGSKQPKASTKDYIDFEEIKD